MTDMATPLSTKDVLGDGSSAVAKVVGHRGAAVRFAKAKFCCSTSRELRSWKETGSAPAAPALGLQLWIYDGAKWKSL